MGKFVGWLHGWIDWGIFVDDDDDGHGHGDDCPTFNLRLSFVFLVVIRGW